MRAAGFQGSTLRLEEPFARQLAHCSCARPSHLPTLHTCSELSCQGPAHPPLPSCGHSSQGSPQPSPGILLQQHRALVVLKALGTEHFPLSKRVKQKLWRVSVGGGGDAQVIADPQEGHAPLATTMGCTHQSTAGRYQTARSPEDRRTGSCRGCWCMSRRGRCWAPLHTR